VKFGSFGPFPGFGCRAGLPIAWAHPPL